MPDWKPEILRRLAPLKLAPTREAEIAEELAQHLEDRYRELLSCGHTQDSAFHTSLDDLKDETLLVRGLRSAEKNFYEAPIAPGGSTKTAFAGILQDIHYAFRTLRKSPGFAVIALLTLALGIGANTAIFSIVDAVLLEPPPFQNPSRLVMLWEGIPEIGFPKVTASAPDLMFYEREQKSFAAVGAFQNEELSLSGGTGEPERITAARVSASIFPMLGVSPLLGRTYTRSEDVSRAHVAVLSYGLWQRRYARDRNIVGRTIALDRVPYTVLGVMPKNFAFPLPGPEYNNSPAALWVPMAFTKEELTGWGNMFNNSVLARLEPGVTLPQAQAEANLIAHHLMRAYPAALLKAFPNAHVHLMLTRFHEEIVGSVETLLLVLMAAVGFVLLIACANVATLLLSRAASRSREIAIRTALGASRSRLIRQMLTESLVLAVAGGVLGVLMALWGVHGLLSLVPSTIPLPQGVALGGSVLAFVAAVCCLTAVLFGIAPAFQASSISLQGSLQEGGRSGTAGHARRRMQAIFVTAEFALALLLLVGAGLLVRSFARLLSTNPGFRPDHVLTMRVPLPQQAYSKPAQVREFYQRALQRITVLPGVVSDGISNDLPLNARETDAVKVEGRRGTTPAVRVSWVLGDYLRTMGISLLRGRSFTPEDRAGSQPVALVSTGAAEALWPGADPLGKRFTGAGQRGLLTVIGVVGDVTDAALGTRPLPHIYLPYLQLPDALLQGAAFDEARSMNVVVRSAGNPTALTSAVTAQIHSLDPDLAIARIRTMDQEMDASVAGPKFNTFLLGIFSVAALLLAAIGIYGVLAYTVSQQTHEIGIRLALGAQRADILHLVLGQGAKLALLGVGIGVVAALGLTRLMSSLLFGVSAMDPLTFTAVAILLFSVALLACYIPARRAMRVDPMVALRYE